MRVFGFAGWSGSGKTTLIEQLIPRFVAHGLTVSLVKHAHHEFDLDQPGKALNIDHNHLPNLADVGALLGATDIFPNLGAVLGLDQQPNPLNLVQDGFKQTYEQDIDQPVGNQGPEIVAVATDGALATALPVLPLGDPDAVATFILRHVGLEVRGN